MGDIHNDWFSRVQNFQNQLQVFRGTFMPEEEISSYKVGDMLWSTSFGSFSLKKSVA
jgi:hypothetical protein